MLLTNCIIPNNPLQLVDVVVKNFGSFFPELVAARNTIHSVIADEETSFGRTLVKGIERFKKMAASLKEKGGAVFILYLSNC